MAGAIDDPCWEILLWASDDEKSYVSGAESHKASELVPLGLAPTG